jgi:hypothetical protein
VNGAAVVLMLDSPISKRAKYTVNGVPFEVCALEPGAYALFLAFGVVAIGAVGLEDSFATDAVAFVRCGPDGSGRGDENKASPRAAYSAGLEPAPRDEEMFH